MCGIFGVVNVKNKSVESYEDIKRITDLLSHRGPDSGGVYVDSNVALGHRRLSILDLSSLANQPFISADKRGVIVFNGEVYNFKDLKQELNGICFRTKSDTEVVLYSFLEYGIKCLNKFNGMFAFAVYDKNRGRVFLVRDRIGIKPLYYAELNGKIVFASELKAIVEYANLNNMELNVDYSALSSYLSFRYPVLDLTYFKEIKTLEPGRLLEIDLVNERINVKKYWEEGQCEGDKREENFYVQKIKDLLSLSVDYRMIADVPVGAFLSGGLDSSIIVYLMSKKGKINTFSIGFKEEGYNEFSYAREIASLCNTEHNEIMLSYEDYFKNLERMIEVRDAPLGVVNEPALFEMTSKMKGIIKVVLSGEGADEVFGGYGRIFRSPFDFFRMQFLKGVDEDLKSLNAFKMLKENFIKKYGRVDFKDEFEFFLNQYWYLSRHDKERFLTVEFLKTVEYDKPLNANLRKIFYACEGDMYSKIMAFFRKVHIQGLLLRLDATTMANSIEGRVPFLDHNLVEFSAALPVDFKLRWKSEFHRLLAGVYNSSQISEVLDVPKYILKKAFKDTLPESVVFRKKMGFPVPVFKWLGGEFRDKAIEVFSDRKTMERGIFNCKNILSCLRGDELKMDYSLGLKLWMLLNIELWYRKKIEGV